MAGLAFGALWSLMATLTSEFFGLHHFASNYTFVQVGWEYAVTASPPPPQPPPVTYPFTLVMLHPMGPMSPQTLHGLNTPNAHYPP